MTEQPNPQQRPPLRRSSSDRVIGGVCGGLARTLGVDPVIVRVIAAVLALLGGTGFAAYLIAWILIPNDQGESALDQSRTGRGRFPQFVLVILLAIAAISLFNAAWPGDHGGLGFLVFILVAVVAWQAFGNDLFTRTKITHDSSLGAPGVNVHEVPQSTAFAVQTPAGTTVVTQEPKSVLGRIVWNALAVVVGGMIALNLTDTADLSGRSFVAVLLGIVALGLIVSAFVGRARGLIAVGLALALLSFPLSWAHSGDVGDRNWRPTAAQVIAADASSSAGLTYELGAGNAVLDLTGLAHTLPPGMVTSIRVRVAAGDVQVILPPDGSIGIDGHVEIGAGSMTLPAESRRDGTGMREDFMLPAAGPQISLDIALGVGNLSVHHAVEVSNA